MEIINKDILEVNNGLICHQVNCKGVMEAGLALQIKNKWAVVYKDYKIHCDNYKHDQRLLLGSLLMTDINDNTMIVNLFSQYDYGRQKRIYTDYNAFERCLYFLSQNKGTNIYFPYKIGCGLAGGDWKTISGMIEEYIPDAIICKL